MAQKNYIHIDPDTGEVVDDKVFVELHEGEFIDSLARKEASRKYFEAKEQGMRFQNWIKVLYTQCNVLFPELNMTEVAYLFYLVTYLWWDGRLTINEGKTFLTKKTAQRLMRMPHCKSTREFWDDMFFNGILYEDDAGELHVDGDRFCKGSDSTDCSYVRMYVEIVRGMFDAVKLDAELGDRRIMQKLGYTFQLIPYINRFNNMLCFTPNINPYSEKQRDEMKYMTVGDLCEALGYGRNNAARLVNTLLGTYINDDAVLAFIVTDEDKATWKIIANPKMFYGGSNSRYLADSDGMFRRAIAEKADIAERKLKKRGE